MTHHCPVCVVILMLRDVWGPPLRPGAPTARLVSRCPCLSIGPFLCRLACSFFPFMLALIGCCNAPLPAGLSTAGFRSCNTCVFKPVHTALVVALLISSAEGPLWVMETGVHCKDISNQNILGSKKKKKGKKKTPQTTFLCWRVQWLPSLHLQVLMNETKDLASQREHLKISLFMWNTYTTW